MPRQNKQNQTPKAARRGVTLIEIALVLVIIGILLGGVLKGQELINNARVRAMADQQISMRAAWFSFVNRFGGMPADYPLISQYVPGAEAGGGDGIIAMWESPKALQQLTSAGYLLCPRCTAATGEEEPGAKNSLVNSYGGIMAIFHNGYFGPTTAAPGLPTFASRTPGLGSSPLMIYSGNLIPSNIVAEVDRKIDDGIANEGTVVFDRWSLLGDLPLECMSTDREKQVNPTDRVAAQALFYRHQGSENPIPNCGFSSFI